MKELIENIIRNGFYVLSELEDRIIKVFALGRLTEEEMEDLLTMAAENANDAAQIDVVAKLKELEDRIHALEHPEPEYVVWTNGYVTAKGETVKYDYNGDGTLDLLRYDGGRASTSLRPGRIDGWHVVDESGNILGTYYNGQFASFEQD